MGQGPTRIFIFLEILCFFVLFSCFQMFLKKIKKMDRVWVGVCLTNPSFSRIFLFFLN